ncbi:unnamed protein product, partial [marine sediment metagenome]
HGRKLLTRPMDVTGEYVGYLYDSLVRRGYLKGNKSRGFALTVMGRGTLFEFLRENKNRTKETINALQRLSIKVGREVDKLEKEAIGVR